MHCQIKTTKAHFYTSILDIPTETFEILGCTENFYLNPKYLSSLAQHHSNIDFSYVVLVDDLQKPIAFATIQIVNFYLDSVQNDLQSIVKRVKCIGRKLRIISPEKPLKILTVGNTFVSGEHGIFIKPNQDKKKVIKDLAKVVLEFSQEQNTIGKIDAFMLKDFVKQSLFISDELLDFNYYSFNVEPNMVLQMDEDWYSFDDYLASMKTKFRVKAKKAMKQSSELEIIELTNKNFNQYLPQITNLYKSVSSASSFNLGDFNLETYKSLKENLGSAYFVKILAFNTKVVGFFSGLFNQEALDAHFVGIDYKLNREYAIYQRMLYEYIKLGISHNVKKINFGRTASEIKSSVGAIPQDMTIYLRHKKSIPNRILSVFFKRIQPTEFKQKFPFKAKELVQKS